MVGHSMSLMGSHRADGVVAPADAARLRARIAADGEHATAAWLGVGVDALARAASGCRVQRGTLSLVRLRLDQEQADLKKGQG